MTRVSVYGRLFALELATPYEVKLSLSATGLSGGTDMLLALSTLPLALEERGEMKGYRRVQLMRFNEQYLVQWFGIARSDLTEPIGRVMRIVTVADE